MQDYIFIITELQGGAIHPVAYELIGKARDLCRQVPRQIACLVLGPQGLALDELNRRGCDAVFYMAHSCFETATEELYCANILAFLKDHPPAVILTGATNFGRSLAPRLAAGLRAGLTADCTQLTMDETGRLIQIRPAFSGNIFAHIRSNTSPQMATIRYKEFPEADLNAPKPGNIQVIAPVKTDYAKARIVQTHPLAGVPITEAQVIVAAGRGVRRKEDLGLLQELASLLGGQLGVSRALVDGGLAPSDRQVGYSGHRVKPRLYIACGISGAPQHVMGMGEAQTIIAINTDPSAPIFSVCHYGIVGDLYDVVPQMIEQIRNEQGVRP